jgi:hypothetical protein
MLGLWSLWREFSHATAVKARHSEASVPQGELDETRHDPFGQG